MRYREREDEGLSVLDRLLMSSEAPGDVGLSGDWILHSIARDLQTLMNCRRKEEAALAEYPEISRSILNFGMPALGGYGHIGTPAEQLRLSRAMEEAIRTFEPRLQRVEVRVLDAETQQRQFVRFRLEANVEGLGMREIFEMRLKPETGEMTVASGGAG